MLCVPAVSPERREISRGRIVCGESIQSQSLRGCDGSIRLDGMRIVLKPPETEVRKQRGADPLVEPRCKAVIMNDRTAADPINSATLATEADAQIALSREAVVRSRIPAQHLPIAKGLIFRP